MRDRMPAACSLGTPMARWTNQVLPRRQPLLRTTSRPVARSHQKVPPLPPQVLPRSPVLPLTQVLPLSARRPRRTRPARRGSSRPRRPALRWTPAGRVWLADAWRNGDMRRRLRVQRSDWGVDIEHEPRRSGSGLWRVPTGRSGGAAWPQDSRVLSQSGMSRLRLFWRRRRRRREVSPHGATT